MVINEQKKAEMIKKMEEFRKQFEETRDKLKKEITTNFEKAGVDVFLRYEILCEMVEELEKFVPTIKMSREMAKKMVERLKESEKNGQSC